MPSWPEGRVELWHPAFPHLNIPESDDSEALYELLEWISDGGLVEAHNAWFERSLWTNILVPKYGFCSIGNLEWRDSAAKAAAHALPRSLEDAVEALGLDEHKDVAGHKLMLKMSKPRKSRKAERALWEKTGVPPPLLLWHESTELLSKLFAYCRQDVVVEAMLSAALPDLNVQESALYVLDQQINERGFQLDQEAVNTALALIASESQRLNTELCSLTQGKVKKATQRAQMLRWFEGKGLDLDDTQAATITEVLGSVNLSQNARRGLEILSTLGKSSTAKYEKMKDWMAPDGRVRGGLIYHGATTGRWSGSGVQPHNFPRGTIKNQEALWRHLKEHAPIKLDIMTALSHGLRGAIIAGPGQRLFVADYSAIEARVVMWLAGQEDALDIFRRGEDIYLDMASTIYDKMCSKEDTQERQLGKATILGCGFQMGASRFVDTAALYGITIDEDFSKRVVDAYRMKYPRVKTLWYDMEQAAVDALHRDNADESIPCGQVTWRLDGRFLYCQLPSGRQLASPNPRLTPRQTPWGETRMQLSFMGVDSHTHQWTRQVTYGGMLVENVTQAVARDVLAEALTRLDATGTYHPVLSVHDEILSEASLDEGSVAEYEALVTESPVWGDGLPLAAEAWTGMRYRK